MDTQQQKPSDARLASPTKATHPFDPSLSFHNPQASTQPIVSRPQPQPTARNTSKPIDRLFYHHPRELLHASPSTCTGRSQLYPDLPRSRPPTHSHHQQPGASRRPVGSPLGFASQTCDDCKLAHCSVADQRIPGVRQTSRLPQTTTAGEALLPPTVSTADLARSCGVRLWLGGARTRIRGRRELHCRWFCRGVDRGRVGESRLSDAEGRDREVGSVYVGLNGRCDCACVNV